MPATELLLVGSKTVTLSDFDRVPVSVNLPQRNDDPDITYDHHQIVINFTGAQYQWTKAWVQTEEQDPLDPTADLPEPEPDINMFSAYETVLSKMVPAGDSYTHIFQWNPDGLSRMQIWFERSDLDGVTVNPSPVSVYVYTQVTYPNFDVVPSLQTTLPSDLVTFDYEMDTVESFISDIRPRIQDVTDLSVPNDEIINYINDGISQIATSTGFFRAAQKYSLSHVSSNSGQSQLNINSSGMGGILSYEPIHINEIYHGMKKLDHAPRNEIYPDSDKGTWKANRETSSYPTTAWMLAGEQLLFDHPISGGDIVDIFYSYNPTKLTSISDKLHAPYHAWPVLKSYVIYRIHEAAREGGQANRMFQEYDNGLKALAKIVNDDLGIGARR